ncbi:MAG TPA: B12-binding domain-containing radical SAM protein, partial [Actinobacteria bacterium]|nr:B12-binding domain-containing radical SAM protein [Actinomycetota bacterium]
KKAAFPPLGLLTVAAMLPEKWDLKLIDMNVDNLNDSDILSADAVFISAMIVQKKSVKDVIKRVKKLGKPIAAGGPLFTTGWEEFTDDVDSLILGEAESNLEDFLNDLSNGNVKKIYEVGEFPSISKAVSPRWNLINMKYYNSMCLQISRGCPFNCDFCDIVKLNGRIPRIKTGQQVINELEALYKSGWKGGVFFVDDNLIGNQRILEHEILPAIIEWQKKRKQPFLFNTQASIDLADKPGLMRLMVKAGFTTIFVGIESPQDESLKECSKYQNKNRDLLKSVNILQNAGFEIQGGFIVGFDSDSPHIFQKQIEFIQKSGIVTAMVGLLNALPQTKLYQRLKETGRLINESSGLNTGMDMNFIPKMNLDVLMDGYKKIVKTIYSPKQYYERVKTFLSEFKPPFRKAPKLHLYYIKALFVSIWYSGIKASGKKYYWKLFFWSVFRRPTMFPYVIGTSITRIHFSKLYCES